MPRARKAAANTVPARLRVSVSVQRGDLHLAAEATAETAALVARFLAQTAASVTRAQPELLPYPDTVSGGGVVPVADEEEYEERGGKRPVGF